MFSFTGQTDSDVSYADDEVIVDSGDSLKDAVAGIPDDGELTVRLAEDIVFDTSAEPTEEDGTTGLVIDGNKKVTVIFDGHTVSSSSLDAVIDIKDGSKFIFGDKGEVSNSSENGKAFTATGSVGKADGLCLRFYSDDSAEVRVSSRAEGKIARCLQRYTLTLAPGINGVMNNTSGEQVVSGGKTRSIYFGEGETATYKAVPDTGYKITSIKVNGEDKAVNYPGGQKVSVTVKEDTKVDVTFAIRKYKITAKKKTSPSGNGGTITGSCYVKYGGSKTFKITPKFGYIVNKVYVDGKNIGRKYEYTFKDVKEKHRITAIFKKANVLKIMLDAGHVGHCNRYVGKFDGGYYYESLMSWQLHKYLKKDLEEYNNVIVDTTRSSLWRDLGVYERGYKAKGYDLFISLHSNYCDSPKTDYPLVIRQLSANQSEKELAAALSQAIGDTMGCREEPSVWTRYYRSGGKKVDYYGVLRGAHAAGCNGYILEHSFHSNRKMALWLYKKSNLRKMARKEANVIAAHYGLRKKDGTAPSTSNVLATPCRVKVTASSLTVRKKAGVSYKKLGTLGKGGVYTIVRTSSSGKWGKLSCDSSGWISLKYVKKVSASSDVRNYTVRKNVSDSLNIRKGPGTKYKSIGKIRSNKSKYTICSETKSGRWGKLKNREGWISLDCVKRVY